METGVVAIQESVSAKVHEGANEYLLSKQADETVKNDDDIEGPPGLVDHHIKAHETKIVPDESNGHNQNDGVTTNGDNFSGSADAPEVPNGSGNAENLGAEQINEKAEQEKATDENSVVETPEITEEKASEAEKSGFELDKQVPNFVEATSDRNEETVVHEPHAGTISKMNDEERILDDPTADSKTEDEMTRKIEEIPESSKVIDEAVSTESQTVQQELHSIESSPIQEETMVESSEALTDIPPADKKEELVRSCKEGEIEENSNQVHEESLRKSTDNDIEERVLEEKVPKDETIVPESEVVDCTTAPEKESLNNAETIENDTEAVETTAEAEEETGRNALSIENETEAVDTTTVGEDKISKSAETILDATEAVQSATATEENIVKDTELLDGGETSKEGHLEQEEITKKEIIQKEGEESTENETEAVLTTVLAEEEIPRNAEATVIETEAVNTAMAEEEKISKTSETILEATEAVHSATAAEEKIEEDAELLDEGKTSNEGHLGQEDIIKKEIPQKEGDETTETETEVVQTTASEEEEISRNAEAIVTEIEAVDTTTVEEEKTSKNAETILEPTEAVDTTAAAEEKTAKDAELLDEGKTSNEGHLEPEDLTKKEMLQKEGETTTENETEGAQTTASAEEEIPRNVEAIVTETEAADTSTAEEESTSKNAETNIETTEAVHTTEAAEEKIIKDAELLDEGEATKEVHSEPDENLTQKETLQKEGEETIKNDTEAVQAREAAEEETLIHAENIVNETEAVNATTAEEEKISKDVETIGDATEAVHTTEAAEEKIVKDAELLDEGDATKEVHSEPDENLTQKETLLKEGEETIKNDTEAVQTTEAAEEETPTNAGNIVNEIEAETIVDATEAVHTTEAAEEKIVKDTELLDEGEAIKEVHPEPEENLTQKETLQKEGDETTKNDTEAPQTTEAAEEETLRNAEAIVNETEAIDATRVEDEKNIETIGDTTEAVHTMTAAEGKVVKEVELLSEGETTKESHYEPEENLLQKEDEEITADETEAVQTTTGTETEIPKNVETAVNETEPVDTTTAEETISKNAETDKDAIDTAPTTLAAEEKTFKDADFQPESDENPSRDSREEMLYREEETKEDKEPPQHVEEEKEGEAEAIKTVILSEEAPQAVDIKDKITGKDTDVHGTDDEVKSSDPVSVQTPESREHTEPNSSGIKELTQEREQSPEADSNNLLDVSDQESQEMPKEKGEESEGSCERSEAATESEVAAEKSEGENKVDEQLLDKSRTEPEEKIPQEEEPEASQIAKIEGLRLEESPSDIPLTVQTEDHGSEDKEELTEESHKIVEVDETNITPEVVILSKDQVAEEADKTGESQFYVEQRGLTQGDLEAEENDQNETGSVEKQVSVEGVGLGETTHDQTLPEVESIEKTEKAPLKLPSEGLEQTTKTVDEKIEEKQEEAGIPDQEGQEKGSSAAETHSPLESCEYEERAQEERSLDDSIPPQEESCLPTEQVDETHSQKEQTEKHESPNEEIPDDQHAVVEEKSDDLVRDPPALPSEEKESGILAESKRIEDEKLKDAEPAADRIHNDREITETPELSSVPSLPAEVSELDETPSSEVVSGLDEQTPKQVEEILEKESEDVPQKVSEKQAPAFASESKEEEQETATDGVTIHEAKGEDEITEMKESQKEVSNAAETEETVIPEEEHHGDPEPSKSDECSNESTQLQEQLQILPAEESKMITTDTSDKLQDEPKEDEVLHEPSSEDTVAADRGLPLEELSIPNEETKASDEQIQIPSDLGDTKMLEASNVTKVTETTADQSLVEEKQAEPDESTLRLKQEETQTEETKVTEKTVALEGSGNPETMKTRLEEPTDLETRNEDKEEDKNQKVPETTEEQEAQADHCLPVVTSEPEQTPSSELVSGLDEETPKLVEDIHEVKPKEADELQPEEISPGEEEQATATDAVTMQESKSDDEVTKVNDEQEKGPAAVEREDGIGATHTKEAEEEENQKLGSSGVEEITSIPAAQSHIEEKTDNQIEISTYALTSEKHVEEPSEEATEIEDDETQKTKTEVTETAEGEGISNTLENVCLNQEDLKVLEDPKQGESTEDQTPLKGESTDDASFPKKAGEAEHSVGPSSTLPNAQTEHEFPTTLDTERDIRDSSSLGDTMEPTELIQKVDEAEVESNEKDLEPSNKSEDTETEREPPVTELTELETVEKQDMKEVEETLAAETKQESSLQQDESRETETFQASKGVEEQSLPVIELNLQKTHAEEVEIQEEQTKETKPSVEEKIQEEEPREIVEREQEIPADQSLSEEKPGEKILILSSVLSSEEPEQALSTENPTDKTEESAKQDVNAAEVEKACLQEELPREPEASKRVGDTSDDTIEAPKPADQPEIISSESLSQEIEQKPDSLEQAEGENVEIAAGEKNEEIRDEKLEDPSATSQKEGTFSPEVKTDQGDATEREINDLVSPEKQTVQQPELREKAEDAKFGSNEETVELQARSEDAKSEEKHRVLVAADSGITGEQSGEKTEETSVAEAENEEWPQQEQIKETDISTAEKSTNDLDFPSEQVPKDLIEEIKKQDERPRELEARIEEILSDQPITRDANIEQEEPSAKEQRKDTKLSEEEMVLQDVVKHEADRGLTLQTAEPVEESQQQSSASVSEDNKHENIDTESEVEEKSKEDSENLEKKSISEASDVSLTEPTVQSKEATPKDGPTVAPGDVMKTLKEVAGEKNDVTSEKSDQISLQEVTNQIYEDNKQTDVNSAVTEDIPEEEKLSGGHEEISSEKNIEEPVFQLESLPAKADKVLAKTETAERNLDGTKDANEETKEITPEVQKVESLSSDGLPRDTRSKIEEQEIETSQMGGSLNQPKEMAEEVQKLEKGIPVILDKEIPVEEITPRQKIAEDLLKNEGEAAEAENIKPLSSEVKDTENVEMVEAPTPRESERNSLSDLLQKVKGVKETKTDEEAKTGNVEEDTEASQMEEDKTEEKKDDEEDGDEHKEDKTSPDSVVMVESRDVNDKTPHKKSHGILSGVGSKVKHSISKVKKAITGKSSHTKPVSPK